MPLKATVTCPTGINLALYHMDQELDHGVHEQTEVEDLRAFG